MLFQLAEIKFEPHCDEIEEDLLDGAKDFEHPWNIVDELENHYDIKIHTIAWFTIIDQTDSAGNRTDTINWSCGLIPDIIQTRIVGVDSHHRKNTSLVEIGFSMILEEWLPNYKIYNDIVAGRDVDPYNGSRFKKFRDLSSKRKGAAFEELVSQYVQNLGYPVKPPENSDHDRIIGPNKVEIKGSTLWEGQKEQTFRWQQIRPAQDYDKIIFLAMYPDRAEFYCSTKQEVSDFVLRPDEDGNFVHNQHGGKTVNSGTFFLQGKPSDFPFMKPIDRIV